MYIIFTVTHLVTSVENGCCPRTLKYLYAVAAAKWIVSFDCKHLYLLAMYKLFCSNLF